MLEAIKKNRHTKQLTDLYRTLSQLYSTQDQIKLFHQNLSDDQDTENTEYLVYTHEEYGLIGSARLYPIEMQRPGHLKTAVWRLDRIHTHKDRLSHLEDTQVHEVLRGFYQSLYEYLDNFSLKNEISLIETSTFCTEHKDLKEVGRWPFVYEKRTPDGYSLTGVLALNDCINVSLKDSLTLH